MSPIAGDNLEFVDSSLRRLAPGLPGSVRFRLLNSLENFERSFSLLDIDREMASFRAITGEEEAAAALIKAIQLRGYSNAEELNPRDHQHKAAVIACVMAISDQVRPILAEFLLTFDFEKKRADVKVPLSNFDVIGGDRFAIQPVEPLDLVSKKEGSSEVEVFDDALQRVAARSNFDNIKRLVSVQANGRNTLLYASDSALPQSSASQDNLRNRKARGLILLVLTIMVLQSRKHQALVRQAISAFLSIIARLPPAGRE